MDKRIPTFFADHILCLQLQYSYIASKSVHLIKKKAHMEFHVEFRVLQ